MSAKQSLSWSIPFSVHRQKAFREIREAFPPISFVRSIIVFTAIFFVIREILLRRFPLIEVEWLRLYMVSIASILVLVIPAALGALVPPRILLKTKGLVVQRGNSTVFYPFEKMASLCVDEHAKPFPVLRISFLTQQADLEFPVAPSIAIPQLQALTSERRFNQ
jgi:hypothetical protein